MARSFASASSQYLTRSDTSITSTPITLASWCYPTSTTNHCNISLGNNGALGQFQIQLNSAGPGRCVHQNDPGTSADILDTINSWTLNAWNHIVGVFAGASSRTVYLNGDTANKGSSTATAGDPTVDFITVGALRRSAISGETNGRIAHAAIWTAALTEAEVVDLYNNGIGADPRNIRPDALAAYWPLLDNDGDADWWGQYNLTATNTPTYAAHPPVLMKSRPRVIVPSAAAPPASSSPWFFRNAILRRRGA